MRDRRQHLDRKLGSETRFTIVLGEAASGKGGGFVEALCLDLNGVAEPGSVLEGDDALLHDRQLSMFACSSPILGKME